MKKIELFFDFLEKHINGNGFMNYKAQYEYNDFHEKLECPDEEGFGNLEHNVYYEQNKLGENIEYEDFLYRNESKQLIRTYRKATNLNTKLSVESEINDYLFDKLTKRYKSELRNMKHNYFQDLMYFKTNIEKKHYFEGVINRIKANIQLVDATKFIVLDRRGVKRNLTKKFLEASLDYFESFGIVSSIKLEEQKTISVTDEILKLKHDILNSKNQFNTRPINEVISHFEPLTIWTNKSKRPFLTQKQFYAYIKMAFIDMVEIPNPKLTLDINKGSFRQIRWLFYEFYQYQINNTSSDKYQKEKYVKLLSDYFTNSTFKAISHNFNKP